MAKNEESKPDSKDSKASSEPLVDEHAETDVPKPPNGFDTDPDDIAPENQEGELAVEEEKEPLSRKVILAIVIAAILLCVILLLLLTRCSSNQDNAANDGGVSQSTTQGSRAPDGEVVTIPIGESVAMGDVVATATFIADTTDPNQPYLCKEVRVVFENKSGSDKPLDWDYCWSAQSKGGKALNCSYVIEEGAAVDGNIGGDLLAGTTTSARVVVVIPDLSDPVATFTLTPESSLGGGVGQVSWKF